MKESELPRYAIIPFDKMDELMIKIDRIDKALQSNKTNNGALGDYISEQEAKKLLNKQTTWFWNKRQSGELSGKKAGNSWYYKHSDILNFIENGTK